MSILSKSFEINFTQVPNQIINDERVSLKAKGLYLYFVSKPDNWDFTLNGMASQLLESAKTILSIIDELCKFGYMDKIKRREGSKILPNDYILHIEPYKMPYSPPDCRDESNKMKVTKCNFQNYTTSNTKQSNKEKSNTSTSQNKKKISFNSFRELFFNSSYKDGFTVSSLDTWSSTTKFRLTLDMMIFNTVSSKLLSKDDAFQIWSYLYEKYLNNEIKGL